MYRGQSIGSDVESCIYGWIVAEEMEETKRTRGKRNQDGRLGLDVSEMKCPRSPLTSPSLVPVGLSEVDQTTFSL